MIGLMTVYDYPQGKVNFTMYSMKAAQQSLWQGIIIIIIILLEIIICWKGNLSYACSESPTELVSKSFIHPQ